MTVMPAEMFSELTTESTRIEMVTATHRLEGNIFLPRAMKENRRLTNLLNSDKRFVALTQVTVTDRTTGQQDATVYPYIQVNMNAIELVKPIENK